VTLDADDPTWPDLLSHPGGEGREPMPLERHLLRVAERARDTTPTDATTADGGSLRDAAWVVGLSHDVGKATEWFQTSLDDRDPDGPSHHARLGGLLAYHALRARGYGPRTRFAGLVAVARHHGTLPNARSFVTERLGQDTTWAFGAERGAASGSYNGAAALQASHLESVRPAFARAVVDRLTGGAGSWEEFLARATASNDAIETVGSDPDERLRDWLADDLLLVSGRRHRPPQPNSGLFEDGTTYLDELRLYGTLTFADKTHAAGVESGDDRIEAEPLTAEQVWSHVETLGGDDPDPPEERLNTVRGEIQRHVAGRREGVDPVEALLAAEEDVATLTLPTGYGKTLTGALAAARIREATGGERIVYALPFTSVVDQTADVLRRVCRETDDEVDRDPALGRRLTVHHNLAEALTLPDADDEGVEGTDDAAERATMLAEDWRAGVTLTTFVQLFESLAGPRNAQSAKLPALHGSVVVVDEPQALPLTWWPLVERLVDALVTEFGATVVLMTATQPRIVDEDDTVSLLDGETLDRIEATGAPDLPDRVEYEFHPTALATGREGPGTLGYDEAARALVDAGGGSARPTLAVCNTIDSAADLFGAVESALGDEGAVDVGAAFEQEILRDDRVAVSTTGERAPRAERERTAFARAIARRAAPDRPALVYLSTRLRPCDREFLLDVVSDLTDHRTPVVVVSTQVVEAGVDVSFDRVFRDFAPLDSIVQAAGRCNRSFERTPETGRVTVWRLGPPEGGENVPGETVYARREGDTDLDLLSKTREALDAIPVGETVAESRVAEAGVRSYHRAVGDVVGTVRSDNELRERFQRADGAELRKRSLITDHLTFEVYVCRTRADHELVAAYRDAERAFEFEEMDRLRDRLARIRVSIPVYDPASDAARSLKRLDPLSFDAERRDATERVVGPEPREGVFDARTGADVPEDTVGGRFF
jgi:CRISPR-associated endonuclease/helicase Cas3/CRISPR-associated endonuclease Cas3-HD